DSVWTDLLAGFIVAGIGIGITNPGIATAAIGVVPAARAGMGAGINNTFRQVGIATGVAGLGAIFQSRIDSRACRLLPPAKPGRPAIVSWGGSQAAVKVVPPDARAQVAKASTLAFTGAMNDILLIGGLLALVGALLGFVLVRQRDLTVPGQAPQQAEGQGEPEAAPA